MKIVITGGGGFLGVKLAKALLVRAQLAGPDGKPQPISKLVLLDKAFPARLPADARLETVAGDIADAATVMRVVTPDTASLFHLAAMVSGAAEADFDLGMRVNFEGTRLLLARLRACATPPRVVFASSVAAFGGELPALLDDATLANPQTSYGTQKVIGEYLIADYSRKGFIDGRSLRLPTIVVRPGKPNAAASSFASAILREPLNGVVSDCPVEPETGVFLLSPRRVTEAFIHAHELPAAAWGTRRVINLPGITVSVAEMIAAMGRIAGEQVVRRVRWMPDDRIRAIVRTWPVRFETPRALALGFRYDPDIETVIRDYIADESINVV
ncbi:MAG: NAD-dependent epimerase/dehydratase family protein [Betaproteobacteria bacterium]|nr:MAG: NAD-dependent epimerase/dehydratase family protein [Betaproteobacteria bacterium]